MEGIGGKEKLKRRKPQFIACSSLRDGGEKSFSKKKYEKRARAVERQVGIFPVATAPFRKSRVSYFCFARFNTSHYTIWEPGTGYPV